MNPDSLQKIIDNKDLFTGLLGNVIFTLIVALVGLFFRKELWAFIKSFILPSIWTQKEKHILEKDNAYYVPNHLSICVFDLDKNAYVPIPKYEGLETPSIEYLVEYVLFEKGEEGKRHKGQTFYMILAPTGIGKSMILNQLFLKYKKKSRLQRTYFMLLGDCVDNESAFWKKVEEIKTDKKESQTILLIDAFDEDGAAIVNSKERLLEICKKTQDFHKVVLTSRQQFFDKLDYEPTSFATKLKNNRKDTQHEFYKLILQPFEDKQIEDYLLKRYSKTDYYAPLKVYLFDTLHETDRQNFKNPLLLSFAQALVEARDSRGKMVKYSYDIYHTIVNEWLRREFKSGISIPILRKFCEDLALKIHGTDDNAHKIIAFQDFIDLEKELNEISKGTRTLLIRDTEDRFKFAHRSFLAYFLVDLIFQGKIDEANFDFKGDDFAMQMFIGKRWRELKHTLPKEEYPLVDYSYHRPIWEQIQMTQTSREELIKWQEKFYQYSTAMPIEKRFGKKFEDDATKEAYFAKWKLFFSQLSKNKYIKPALKISLKRILEKEDTDYKKVFEPIKNQMFSINDYESEIFDYCHEFLTLIVIENQEVIDISNLEKFKKLKQLSLYYNQIKDISILEKLQDLTQLDIHYNQIKDISVLRYLKKLEYLDISGNLIEDINVLKEFQNLVNLSAHKNEIKDISVLRYLKKLECISLSDNQISDFFVLKELKELKELYLGKNGISDISFLKELKKLTLLILSDNEVKDLSPLIKLPLLKEVQIINNPIENISQIEALRARGVKVVFKTRF